MSRYDKTPVQPEKIQLIHELLNDMVVGDYYRQWLRLKAANAHVQLINRAFQEYAIARDKWLGLPPLSNTKEIQNNRVRVY